MDESATGGLKPLSMPAGLTFGSLLAGLLIGWFLAASDVIQPILAVTAPIGQLWLRALQMTIIPLVASLLIMGIARMVETASAGPVARRTLASFIAILGGGTIFAAVATPAVLRAFPIPANASNALALDSTETPVVPGIGEFLTSLVAPNIFTAAVETAMLPLIVFFGLFAVAVTRLESGQKDIMLRLFQALANAMLTIIGWVLWVAPVGVFALAIGVSAQSGGGAIAALGHYILVVSSMGFAVLLAAYIVGPVLGRRRFLGFARAVLPAQAVAISTQSSLASVPAMLASCSRLGIRERISEFVLPLAVAIFRATSPAMNLAVAIYVAKLTGVEITPGVIAAGAAVAMITTVGSVSLPGSISFVTSIGPIALAMGVPVEPLALLVAVEMLPDIMRTVGNVTMDVAVAAVVDRFEPEE